jgi:hypothetical protein
MNVGIVHAGSAGGIRGELRFSPLSKITKLRLYMKESALYEIVYKEIVQQGSK